jgi:hypothetical protein
VTLQLPESWLTPAVFPGRRPPSTGIVNGAPQVPLAAVVVVVVELVVVVVVVVVVDVFGPVVDDAVVVAVAVVEALVEVVVEVVVMDDVVELAAIVVDVVPTGGVTVSWKVPLDPPQEPP